MAERSWVIGNAVDCDICVEGRTVSARHCRIIERGESFLLEDLQSTNGTYVAGERITGPRIVRRGDPVTLGQKIALPWPPIIVSITVGRLPDNDLMIPLETVSAHHATRSCRQSRLPRRRRFHKRYRDQRPTQQDQAAARAEADRRGVPGHASGGSGRLIGGSAAHGRAGRNVSRTRPSAGTCQRRTRKHRTADETSRCGDRRSSARSRTLRRPEA